MWREREHKRLLEEEEEEEESSDLAHRKVRRTEPGIHHGGFSTSLPQITSIIFRSSLLTNFGSVLFFFFLFQDGAKADFVL